MRKKGSSGHKKKNVYIKYFKSGKKEIRVTAELLEDVILNYKLTYDTEGYDLMGFNKWGFNRENISMDTEDLGEIKKLNDEQNKRDLYFSK